jgi:hypothetical protein
MVYLHTSRIAQDEQGFRDLYSEVSRPGKHGEDALEKRWATRGGQERHTGEDGGVCAK